MLLSTSHSRRTCFDLSGGTQGHQLQWADLGTFVSGEFGLLAIRVVLELHEVLSATE